MYSEFWEKAVLQTPEGVILTVQRLTVDTIDQPDQRKTLLKILLDVSDHLMTQYYVDIDQVGTTGFPHDGKTVSAKIYKAAYLAETVYMLCERDSSLRESARRKAVLTHKMVERMERDTPDWKHEFPLSAKIAGMSVNL